MTDSAPYSVPKEPGRWRAITLAAVVHAALLALLWFGVSWQNETPQAVEAEVWSPQTREAAPLAQPQPEPEPSRPVPIPREVVKPIPAPLLPEPDERDAQIALEQEKKRTQKAKREEEQELKQKQLAEQVRQEKIQQKNERRAAQKAEQLANQKREDQIKAQQLAETQEKQKAATLAEQKKVTIAKQRKEQVDALKLAASRDENLARMRNMAGTASPTSGSGGSGDAAKSQGSRADASYIDKVRVKIKSNTIFNGADQLNSNPAVEFAVELLPDGSTRRIRKLKSSGVPGFDEAVERAIEKSQPFPPDKSGSAPASFTVSYKPKDQ